MRICLLVVTMALAGLITAPTAAQEAPQQAATEPPPPPSAWLLDGDRRVELSRGPPCQASP